MEVATTISIVQLVLVVVAAFVAYAGYKKSHATSELDFLLGSEGQIDPLRNSLIGQSSEVIRACYPNQIPEDFSESEVTSYVYMYLLYSHISRMYFVFDDTGFGNPNMSKKDRDYTNDLWINLLVSFKSSRVMQAVHANAKMIKEHNTAFLTAAETALIEKKAE